MSSKTIGYISREIINYKDLILQLTKREVLLRYKGSYLGIFWSLLNPLFMLAIYTYFFSFVLNSRWDTGSDNKMEFALILFCGITIFNLFSEVITRAPSLIIANVNYVKKVVFPLHILPVVTLLSAIVQMMINFFILVFGIFIVYGSVSWTIVFLPLVVLPLMLLTLGLAWFVSSLGVYFRDLNQILVVVVQALMFLSPIFYPITIIPEYLRAFYYFNPISYVVEDVRNILIWGEYPNWQWLVIGTLIGMVVSILGYMWFKKTKGGFSDVL